jgi:hypothetical protein
MTAGTVSIIFPVTESVPWSVAYNLTRKPALVTEKKLKIKSGAFSREKWGIAMS